jgi:hypothetical protein
MLVQVWPIRVGQVTWRFGAAGLLAGAIPGTVLGLSWSMGVAALLEHRRFMVVLGVLNLLLGLGLLGVCALFALDFTQVRATVAPELRRSLDITVIRAMAILVAAIPATLILGFAALRMIRLGKRSTVSENQKGGLVYRAVS